MSVDEAPKEPNERCSFAVDSSTPVPVVIADIPVVCTGLIALISLEIHLQP